MQMPPDIARLAEAVVTALTAEGLTISTAESCTGGLIAGALTSVAGSSAVVYGGFVTYANEAKIAMVGVPFGLLRAHGAVSKEVAMAMAEGALAAAGTHLGVAVTGVAGPVAAARKSPWASSTSRWPAATRPGTCGRRSILPGRASRSGMRASSRR